ncbi:MAG: hypothetical protein CL853_09070 [Crocinitomicaceae bacterium]|nr:hypothetical protein [Crocinitomicaceae bacterium]
MRISILFTCIFIFLLCSKCSNNKENSRKNHFDNKFEILISDSSYNRLNSYIEKAIQLGIITPELKTYIKGTLKYKGQQLPIKLRFKGDWTDHLQGEKWSFRISVLGENSFEGLKSFSIQSPNTRTFLEEWLIHKLFYQENILTTRYEFIDVKLNGKDLGIYAYEEHFQKQLIEYNKRREGPIVKFNEEGIWETRIKKEFYHLSFPSFEAADVIPFKKSKTLRKITLKKNFDNATQLMLNYKSLEADLNEIFDLENAAKYFALCDLARVRHALHWQNQRFYFNPITNQLEHIGFDCFSGFNENEKDIILGYTKEDKNEKPIYFLNKQFFNSPIFKKHYCNYLEKYSSEEFINKIERKYYSEINSLKEKIQIEYPNYNFNLNRYKENARLIDSLLPYYKKNNFKFSPYKSDYSQLDTIGKYFFPSIGLKSTRKNNNKEELLIKNYHFSTIEILGFLNKDNKVIPFKHPLNKKIVLNKYTHFADSIVLPIDSTASMICFVPKNTGKIELNKIQYWKYDASSTIELTNYKSSLSSIPPSFKIDSTEKTILLKKGDYTFEKNITIPQGWKLQIEKGSNLQLNNSSFILSYSPISFLGTKTSPITINNGSLVVLCSKKDTSEMLNVNFINCRLNDQSNWTLTGAVTFYNSTVEINNCSFSNNISEDALNLISSNFTLKNSVIENTTSDGFDADFCNGVIDNCTFSNTKNDGVDISGSNVTIKNCELINIKDKAISSGENSFLQAINCSIDSANIGLASKDKSLIKASNISVSNSNVCYAVFQKKAEYNPATINLSNSKENNYNNLYLVDYKSRLELNNKTIIGSKHINVDSLYIPFK